MIFERNFGYFLIIVGFAIIGAVVLKNLSPLSLILALIMIPAGYGFIRQVRLEAELIRRSNRNFK